MWSLLDPAGGCSRWLGAASATWDGCPAGPTARRRCASASTGSSCGTAWSPSAAGSVLVRLVRPTRGPLTLCHIVRAGGFDPPRPRSAARRDVVSNGAIAVIGGDAVIDGDYVVVDVAATAGEWHGLALRDGRGGRHDADSVPWWR